MNHFEMSICAIDSNFRSVTPACTVRTYLGEKDPLTRSFEFVQLTIKKGFLLLTNTALYILQVC